MARPKKQKIVWSDPAIWPKGADRYLKGCRVEILELMHAVRRVPYLDAWKLYDALMEIGLNRDERAVLGLYDRYFLLVFLLERKDIVHHGEPGVCKEHEDDPDGNVWLYDRVREVELAPDDYLDLWARDHYKSTVITFSGIIQEILRDPNISIAIFSHIRPMAKKFLRQVMQALEMSDVLKETYSDVLFADPRKESPKWSQDEGILVRRTAAAATKKEATVEAWGLVDGMPTGSHFELRVYDDVIEQRSSTNPEMVQKVVYAWELSDNLGVKNGRRWHIGTRYTFADAYQPIIDGQKLKPRIYPATDDGTMTGKPVFISNRQNEQKKRDQEKTYPAQMLQNPAAGKDTTFDIRRFSGYWIRPEAVNILIMCDPSMGSTRRSDRTGMVVVAIDSRLNKFLVDGYLHRMDLGERFNNLLTLYRKWTRATGVGNVRIGYERFGMQSDLEYFEEKQRFLPARDQFALEELSWGRDNAFSKIDRIQRLAPDFHQGKFLLPSAVWSAGKLCKYKTGLGLVEIEPMAGEPGEWNAMRERGTSYLIVDPLKQIDENGDVYDLTVELLNEAIYCPFGTHDDGLDALSRVYDMQPDPAMIIRPDDLNPTVYADGV